MKTIKINVPQMVFETIEFTMPNDCVEEIANMSDHEKAKLAINHMTDQQVNWLPSGEVGLRHAFEYGYTKIKIS